MIPFRIDTPQRRGIATVVSKYSDHREELKKDYKYRCGYCDDSDNWRTVWFEVDHFVPQKYLVTIKDTDYSNLVYSCRSCNNSKRAHWPTADELVHHKDDEGFIDPCHVDYDKQFQRYDNGRIIYQTQLGKWMYYKLKLHKPQHEIIWQIRELDKLIQECEAILIQIDNQILKDKLLGLYREYYRYTKELGNS